MDRTLPGRCLAAVLMLPAVVPAPALAQGSPPPLPGDAAIYQYREAVPTGAGPVAPTPGTSGVTPLPAAAAAALAASGGEAAPVLGKIATSSDYGAPQGFLRKPDVERASQVATPLPSASPTRTVRAAASSIGDVPGRVLVLLTVLLATVAAVFMAARRTSRHAV